MYDAIVDSLRFYTDRYAAHIVAYCLMPSHVHFVIVIDGERLGPFMRDFKKFISQKKAPEIGIEEPNIWEERYDRVVIATEDVLRTKVEYIHRNPVKAGLVATARDWR